MRLTAGSLVGGAIGVVILGLGYRILTNDTATFVLEIWLGTVLTVVLTLVGTAFAFRAAQPKRASAERPQTVDGAFSVVNAPQLGRPQDAPAQFSDAGATHMLGVSHDVYQ